MFTQIGRDRLACAGITAKKDSTIKILPFLFRVSAGNCDSSKGWLIFLFLLTTVLQFMFLSACLPRTREVKQVFFISIVT